MITVYIIAAVTLFAVGIAFMIQSARPRVVTAREVQGLTIDWYGMRWWIVSGFVLGLLVAIVSGWPALALGVAGLVWVARLWSQARAERKRYYETTEAISTWADMIKDSLSGGAGLSQAIDSTTNLAPEIIKDRVIHLSAGQRVVGVSEALRQFGRDMAHPTADLVALALISASENQARDLPSLLEKASEQARSRNAAVLEIETERAKLYTEARAMVVVIAVLGALIAIVSSDFLTPYGSLAGQLVLTVVCALIVGSGAALVQAGRPKPEKRLLALEQEL